VQPHNPIFIFETPLQDKEKSGDFSAEANQEHVMQCSVGGTYENK